MITKVLVLLLVFASAQSRPEDLYTQADVIHHSQPIYEATIPYEFAYAVNDEYAGADFGHSEQSDGENVKGSYSVQLPDGRKQVVTYVADDYGGYVAQVQYYGQAQYPATYGPPVTFRPIYEPQLGYQ
ncbi:cuticle protein-like [Macrobrachium rosenbergii]|uniref:cuticle protein-like n=1 Tax=Macrobrachium rosenbergii TaxID=79674 RepID=UPI0034D6ADE9